MYKVFVNDKPIIFTTSIKNEYDFLVYRYKNTMIEALIYKLKAGKAAGFYLFSNNLSNDWLDFRKEFKVVLAGGGLVFNNDKETLFIKRNGRWDLPKGKVEKGEKIEAAALREVEEECGIKNLTIQKKLINTCHLFIDKNNYRLKETHWYLMYSNYKGELTPQLEEGITEVAFKNKNETKKAFLKSYPNLQLVYNSYLKNVKK